MGFGASFLFCYTQYIQIHRTIRHLKQWLLQGCIYLKKKEQYESSIYDKNDSIYGTVDDETL